MKTSKVKAAAIQAMYEIYFGFFTRLCFESLHPNRELAEGFHIDVICKALVDLLREERGGLVINVPPRSLKSFIASVAFPLFAVRRKPGLGILVLAGTQSLATEFLGHAIKILEASRYRGILAGLTYSHAASTLHFSNGGSIQFAVYGHNIIGKGFDLCIVDDPQSPTVAKNLRQRKEANTFFDDSVLSRMNRSGSGKVVIVQQRLHENDLSGHLFAQGAQWGALVLPAVATTDETWATEWGRCHRQKGDVICAERESRDQLRARLLAIGGVEFSAQYQQAPFPGESPSEQWSGVYAYYKNPADRARGEKRVCFGKRSEATFVDTAVFGVDHGFAGSPTMSMEEWEPMARAQQARLLESCRQWRATQGGFRRDIEVTQTDARSSHSSSPVWPGSESAPKKPSWAK